MMNKSTGNHMVFVVHDDQLMLNDSTVHPMVLFWGVTAPPSELI